jgi:hypothetical protein
MRSNLGLQRRKLRKERDGVEMKETLKRVVWLRVIPLFIIFIY